VRKAGSRLRIIVQLINVTDGYCLWSERYDRELEDVFAVQDEIAENIVRALRVVLTDQEKRAIDKPRTGSVEAYEFYLRGRQAFNLFREKSLQYARRTAARSCSCGGIRAGPTSMRRRPPASRRSSSRRGWRKPARPEDWP
jgi:hypothetical protein